MTSSSPTTTTNNGTAGQMGRPVQEAVSGEAPISFPAGDEEATGVAQVLESRTTSTTGRIASTTSRGSV